MIINLIIKIFKKHFAKLAQKEPIILKHALILILFQIMKKL